MSLSTESNEEILFFLEELYVSKCKDTLEKPMREEFLRFNSRLKSKVTGPSCVMRNQHFGVSASNTLSKYFRNRDDLIKLDLYCNSVKDQGFHVLSHFVQLNKNIKVFNIGCNDLTDKSAPQILGLIESNHVTSIQLGVLGKPIHPNNITPLTLFVISDILQKPNCLKSLGLSGSSFEKIPAPHVPFAEVSLAKIIKENKQLLHLAINRCGFDNERFLSFISDGLKNNSTLKRLSISGNNLQPDVGVKIAEYLNEPVMNTSEHAYPRLFYIDMSNNCFNSEVAVLLSSALSTHHCLGYLDLSMNIIEDEGALAIANSLSTNTSLVELHLSDCKLSQKSGVMIAKALLTNCTLISVNLSKNKLGDETALAFSETLKKNSSMTNLNLASISMTSNGGIQLSMAADFCESLVSIDMSDNFFSEETGRIMEKIYKKNKNILKINVSGTQINHFSYQALNEICARNMAIIKKEEKRPLRSKFLKLKFIKTELDIKNRILRELSDKTRQLQLQIDEINSEIRVNQNDEDSTKNILTKNIVEREQFIELEKHEFKEKKQKLETMLSEQKAKKESLKSLLESQQRSTADTRIKIEEKKAILQKTIDDFEHERQLRNKEIEVLSKAADELFELSNNPEELSRFDELPQFITIEDSRSDFDLKSVGENSNGSKKKTSKRRKSKK